MLKSDKLYLRHAKTAKKEVYEQLSEIYLNTAENVAMYMKVKNLQKNFRPVIIQSAYFQIKCEEY